MQFIDNIFLLQYSKKESVTAKELDLRLLGKVIIFRDTQILFVSNAGSQLLPVGQSDHFS